jgi:hypothetical protein
MDPRAHQLLAVAAEAQGRISEAIDRMSTSEIAGTRFDQAGLSNGLKIVEDYVRAGELGVAFDHLLYMVAESEIPLSSSGVHFLEETAAAFGLPSPRVPVAH